MGQVVPKMHIAMVYEQSKHPNADTVLQGYLGRMCGYRIKGAHTDVDIYVSAMAEEPFVNIPERGKMVLWMNTQLLLKR